MFPKCLLAETFHQFGCSNRNGNAWGSLSFQKTKLSPDYNNCSLLVWFTAGPFFKKFLSLLGLPHISIVSCIHLPITQVLIRCWAFLAHTGSSPMHLYMQFRSQGSTCFPLSLFWYMVLSQALFTRDSSENVELSSYSTFPQMFSNFYDHFLL